MFKKGQVIALQAKGTAEKIGKQENSVTNVLTTKEIGTGTSPNGIINTFCIKR